MITFVLRRGNMRTAIGLLTRHCSQKLLNNGKGVVASPLCSQCEEDKKTVLHFISSCPAYSNPRWTRNLYLWGKPLIPDSRQTSRDNAWIGVSGNSVIGLNICNLSDWSCRLPQLLRVNLRVGKESILWRNCSSHRAKFLKARPK